MFTYSTNVDRMIVNSFIQEKMEGLNWELVSTSEMTAQEATMFAFLKDNRDIVITVSAYQEDQTYLQFIISNQDG